MNRIFITGGTLNTRRAYASAFAERRQVPLYSHQQIKSLGRLACYDDWIGHGIPSAGVRGYSTRKAVLESAQKLIILPSIKVDFVLPGGSASVFEEQLRAVSQLRTATNDHDIEVTYLQTDVDQWLDELIKPA